MLRFLRSLWIWFAASAAIFCWLPLLAAIRLTDHDPLRLRTGRWFRRLGRIIARINPWQIEISGREHVEPGRAYVIVSNHQSLGDIPLLSHLELDTKWLGKAELFRLPVAGWMMRMAGDVPVERKEPRKAAQALLQCARYIRQGCSVVFFPEGTRSRTGEVLPFNDGPFQLAIREKAPVLPVAIEGSYSLLPKDSWLFSERSEIFVSILPPVPAAGRTTKQAGELRDQVRAGIAEEVARLRAAADKKGRSREAPPVVPERFV